MKTGTPVRVNKNHWYLRGRKGKIVRSGQFSGVVEHIIETGTDNTGMSMQIGWLTENQLTERRGVMAWQRIKKLWSSR